MNNAFQQLFSPVRAEEELKDRTREYLFRKTRGYTGGGRLRKGRYYAAACLCLLVVLLGGRWLYFTPVAAISVDINPSIELGINRFDRVIVVSAFNQDGQDLSNTLDIKYRSYKDAIEEIINHDAVAALLSKDEVMTITVIGPEGQRSDKILSEVAACAKQKSNTYCYFAQSEEVSAAHEMGLSCGKYRAFLELHLLDPSITPDVVQKMTMREIRELTEHLTAGGTSSTPSYNGWGNGQHGHGNCGNGRGETPA